MNLAKFRPLLVFLLCSPALLTCQTGSAAGLSGAFAGLPPGTSVDLSAEGELDWAHWGLTDPASFDHKNSITPFITDYILLGADPVQRTDNIGVGYGWSDGVPTVFATNSTTAVLTTGTGSGFLIQVPADVFPRRLQVYVGVYSAQGRLEATLSDGSAPAYTDISLDTTSGESNRVYSIQFAAAAVGQNLTVQFTVQATHDATLGSVRLHAAALLNDRPPTVILNSPTNETASASPAIILFDATADDPDVNGLVRKVDFFANNVLLATITNSPYTFLWTNAALGVYDVTAVATGNDGQTASAGPATVYVYTNTGMLTASVADSSGTIDLTAEGVADWAHWGLLWESTYTHKSGVAPQISNFHFVRNGPAYQFYENTVGYSWNDGTPTPAVANSTTGVYLTDVGDGFEFTVPADTTLKTLKVYLGVSAARGKLRVLPSDDSAAPVFDSSVQAAFGDANAVYSITFKAGSSNQTLGVQYTVAQSFSTFGNVTLQASTLTTANRPPGAAITNIQNGAVFLNPTNLLIQAAAWDPDGSVSKVEFFDGTTKLVEFLSSPFEFVWTNTPPGRHTVIVRATDNNGVTFTSPAVDLFVTAGGGMLSGGFAASPGSADLSAMGDLDWAHWGLSQPNSFNHRVAVPQKISDVTKIGDGQFRRFTGCPTTFVWTNGTPTLENPGSTAGIFLEGLGRGFQITVPADTTKRRLKVFVGIYAALARFEASLSDASAPAYVSSSLSNVWNVANGCYTIDYAAASPNQTLGVSFSSSDLYDVDFGNVTWEAATLAALDDLRLFNVQKSGDSLSFSFQANAGQSYAVEYTDAFPATNWTTLTNLLGDGALAGVVDAAATAAQRFYRVKSD